jgi:hypothetical protein
VGSWFTTEVEEIAPIDGLPVVNPICALAVELFSPLVDEIP